MKYTKNISWWGYKDKNNNYKGLWVQKTVICNGCTIDYNNLPIYQIFIYEASIEMTL